MAIPVDSVRQTYGRVRSGKLGLAAAAGPLEAAVETLTELRNRIRKLEPPAAAAVLHRRLVALDEAQVAFAAEVAALARYLPALTAQERALGAAGTRLSARLQGTRDPGVQSAAFSAFSATVSEVTAAIAAFEAPTALDGARASEAARTAELADLSARLGRAIADEDAALVSSLLRRFAGVAQSGSGGIERSAVLAFNRSVTRIADLEIAVEKERSRLDRDL